MMPVDTADIEILQDDLQGRYLVFNIDDTHYGTPLRCVTEIVGVQPITRIPNLPNYIKGVINLRGKIIPIIDVRLKLGLPERPHDERTCIIVVITQEMLAGLVVDTVEEVVTIAQGGSAALPEAGTSGERYLSSVAKIGDKIILAIDIDKFFASDLGYTPQS